MFRVITGTTKCSSDVWPKNSMRVSKSIGKAQSVKKRVSHNTAAVTEKKRKRCLSLIMIYPGVQMCVVCYVRASVVNVVPIVAKPPRDFDARRPQTLARAK